MTQNDAEELQILTESVESIVLTLISEKSKELTQSQDPIEFEKDRWNEAPHLLPILANKMAEKMIQYGGVGLSMNQVGLRGRMFVMRTHPDITVCVNPRIVDASQEEVLMEEGCLTYPGLHVKVKRPAHLRVRYQTATGETVTEKLTGLTARVFQHQLGVINGEKFFDLAKPLARELALRKWNKFRKQLNLKRKFGYAV